MFNSKSATLSLCLHHHQIIVREMNRLGMAVDLSKSSVKTMRDVLAITEAPIIFSHSSAFGLCNSSRNVHDEILKLVTRNGGLVMVNFYNKFLSCNENATVHDAVGKLIFNHTIMCHSWGLGWWDNKFLVMQSTFIKPSLGHHTKIN